MLLSWRRHLLAKQKMLAIEARKQQQLVALDLKNYRKVPPGG